MKEIALTIKGSGAPTFNVQTPSEIKFFDLNNLLSTGITILFVFSILLTLFFLVYGGISFITSGGDKQKVVAARQKLTYAVIGLIVVFSAYFIVNLVYNLFGIRFMDTSSWSFAPNMNFR